MNYFRLFLIIGAVLLLGAACAPQQIQTATDGGIWLSEDLGENWDQRVIIYEDGTRKRTIADINVKKLLFSPGDERKIFAVSESKGLWVSWNEGHNWDQILASSEINDVVIDINDPKIIYAAVGGFIVQTKDEGITWKSIYASDLPTTKITSITIDPKSRQVIFAGTNEGNLLISENNGLAWRIQAKSAGGAILKLQFHPNKNATLYAGIETKGLARSFDQGKNWEFFDNAFAEFQDTNIFRDFSLVTSGIVYASKYGLLRSLNQGTDWTNLPLISGRKDSNIQAISTDPDNPIEVYYGTNSTFYYSLDGGFNWVPRELPSTRSASTILISSDNHKKIYLGVSRTRN